MPRSNSEFKRIAHRGASCEAPENTIPAIALAAEKYAVDMVEIDLRLSQDGVLVVFHDPDLERTTNGKGPVSRYPLKELKTFDAGFRFDPETKGKFPYREKGITIPTLEEVLTKFPDAGFCLELKERSADGVEKILALIRRIPRKAPLILGSFHGEVARALRRALSPPPENFLARDEVIRTYLAFRFGLKKFSPPARFASLPRSEYGFRLDDAKWISFLHLSQVQVFYWTVDEAREMERLIENGADGIMTNYPDRLNAVLSG